MAPITKRGDRSWRVQVRRNGLPPQSKTFEAHADGKRWAEQLEGRIASDDFVDLSEAKRTTLGEALKRYLEEATPGKKGAKQETNRIKAWLRDPLADRPLASIRTMDIAGWRNERTQAGKAPTTIKNALTIISQVYQLAATEWGMEGRPSGHVGESVPVPDEGRDAFGLCE